MIKEDISRFCEDRGIDLLLADGFEDALIGYVPHLWQNKVSGEVAVYDRSKCIQILVDREEMTIDEAEEYFQFNVEVAYVGKQTPIFIQPIIDFTKGQK